MKFFNIHSFFGTVMVFILMILSPSLLNLKILRPFSKSITDFQITDIWLSKLSGKEFVNVDTNIVIVNTKGLDNLRIAGLIQILNDYKPKVIGLENILKKGTNSIVNEKLFQAVSQAKSIVLGCSLANYDSQLNIYHSIYKPDDIFLNQAQIGFTNLIFGNKTKLNTVREINPVLKVANRSEFAFAVKVAGLFNHEAAREFLDRQNEKEIINYRGDQTKFYLIDDPMELINRTIPAEMIFQKIVLLGKINTKSSGNNFNDVYFTPMDSSYTGRYFPYIYGILIQANIVSMIINKDFYYIMPDWIGFFIAFVITYLNFHIFFLISGKKVEWYEIVSNASFLIESFGILLLTVLFYGYYNIEAKLTIPLLSVAITVFIFEVYRDTIKPMSKRLFVKFSKGGSL